MAAIASISVTNAGSFAAAISTLTSSDTITFDSRKKQLLVVRNNTGSSVTLKIDGDGGTTVTKPGIGSVTVSGGYDTVIANGACAAVVLGSIRDYCQGVVTLTGASGATAQLFDI
jgi:hypothetical protein